MYAAIAAFLGLIATVIKLYVERDLKTSEKKRNEDSKQQFDNALADNDVDELSRLFEKNRAPSGGYPRRPNDSVVTRR